MAVIYNGIKFDTPLLAQWAAFFDLAGYQWSTKPSAVADWLPDFRVELDCNHSECGGGHVILISVLPTDDLSGVRGHPALSHRYGVNVGGNRLADAGAVFGSSPQATCWEMSHGPGGGIFRVVDWESGAEALWLGAKRRIAALG